MMPILRPVEARDLAQILALNEAALPHVNSISRETLEALAAMSCYFRVACVDSLVAGFLLAMREGTPYSSDNYRWFSKRYCSFVYVDRVVIAPAYFRRGIGGLLYQDLVLKLSKGAPRIVCEVNLEPPNPGSISFHQSMGFSQVGQQPTEGGKKQVALLCKSLAQ
ncbi:MAG: GNAT family N-acetyltransferase [Gammaproteobacteria bacterium]|nr:GNAT family N-acetyltransferase [Gammaproteobacteria bacterium]